MSPLTPASNIFHYATTELSQDAILCWLVSCTHHEDPVLSDCGTAFVRALFRTGTNSDDDEVYVLDPRLRRKVPHTGVCKVQGLLEEPSQQYENIDVYFRARIDGQIVSFLIEDKVDSTFHDNQLSRYLKTVATDARREDCIKPIYLKTGYVFEEEREYVKNRRYFIFDLQAFLNFFYDKRFLRRMDSSESSFLWKYREHILSKHHQREKKHRELLSGDTPRFSHVATLNKFTLDLRDQLSEDTSWVPSTSSGLTWKGPANKKRYGQSSYSWMRKNLKSRREWTEVRQHGNRGKLWSELWFCNEFFWEIGQSGRVSLKRDFGNKDKSDRELCQRYHEAFVKAVDLFGGCSEKAWSFRKGQKCTIGSVQLNRQQTPRCFIRRFSSVQAEFLRRIPAIT